MEYISNKPQRFAKTRHKSQLVFCFLVSAGICFGVVPVLPTNSATGSTNPNGTYLKVIIPRIPMLVLVFILQAFMIRCIRRRNQFHQDQRVFWPSICAHCARAVGLLDRDGCANVSRYSTANSESPTAINTAGSQGLLTVSNICGEQRWQNRRFFSSWPVSQASHVTPKNVLYFRHYRSLEHSFATCRCNHLHLP